MNSKQIVAALSVIVLLVLLIYPAISTGTVSVSIQSTRIAKADHVYLNVNKIWVHQKGQSSSAGWNLVSNKSQNIDLVSIGNSTQPLASGQASVANYDSIRVQVSNVTWVFNKTTTALQPISPNLEASLEFTVAAGKDVSISLVLGGHQETTFLAASLNATLTRPP